MTTIITASTSTGTAPGQRSRRRAAVPTVAASAPRSTTATPIAAAILPLVLQEIDRLIAQGVGYIYFIDEIFLPQKPLLEALVERKMQFGVQTRIDLWKPDAARPAGRGRLRFDRGGHREPDRRRTRGARQALPPGRPRTWRNCCSSHAGTCRSCRRT